MSLSVFISATRKDLYPDCLKPVVKAIQYQPGADATEMETWITEHRNPLDECLERVENADCYIGIFAFWRGHVPPGETRSITQAEATAGS